MQLNLFTGDPSPRTLARRTDPPTSHEAARQVVESGSASACKAAVLARLQLGPATSVELAALPGLNYRARISDLRRDGHDIEADTSERPTVYRLRGRGL